MKKGIQSIPFDEVVFENRNKSYGAYFLRRLYENSIILGFIIGTSLVSLLLAAPVVYSSIFAEKENKAAHKVVEVVMETPVEEEVEPEKEPEPEVQVATIKEAEPEVKEDKDVPKEELPPKDDDLKNKTTGKDTKDGVDPNSVLPEKKPETTPTPAQEENKIYDWTPEPAQFPGGPSEFLKYLRSNIEYPEKAINEEKEGTVKVSFVVNIDGSISDIKIVKGVGYGLDEVAMRVIKNKKMPLWKPGKKKDGQIVPVRVVWPIVFDLLD